MSTSEQPGRSSAISPQDLRRIVRGEVRRAVANQRGDHSQTASEDKESGGEEPTAVTPAQIRMLIRQELSAVQQTHGGQHQDNHASDDTSSAGDGAQDASQAEPALKGLTVSDVKRLIQQALGGRSRPPANRQAEGHKRKEAPPNAHGQKSSASSGQANSSSASSAPDASQATPSSSSPSGHHNPAGSSTAPPSQGGTPPSSQASASSQSAEAVASVLTEAQSQLSHELEANLKQLRHVIHQSQEVARKIERVLGQGTEGNQGSS